MSNEFLTAVGVELTMPERSTVEAHPAGWLVRSPGGVDVYDARFERALFTARFEGCGTSTVSDALDYAAVTLRDRAQLRGRDGAVLWEHVHGGWPQWGTGSAYWDSATETFAFTEPGDDSDLWHFVHDGMTTASVELTELTAGGSHVSRSADGRLGLSMGAGQDGCAVYWVDPRTRGGQLDSTVYDDEILLDVRGQDSVVTLTHETDVLRVRSTVGAVSIATARSDEIGDGMDEGVPFHWVVAVGDRLVACAGDDEERVFAAAADLGSWTELDRPTGVEDGTVLVGGHDGLYAGYDWSSGAVRLWQPSELSGLTDGARPR
ncbi:hypothetical protein [Rhodococcus triatomae]|nr:hypothetical protein G419_13011 [Rhodococcus triatomae BKS 15-14]